LQLIQSVELKGNPMPYLSMAIMLTAAKSYLFAPASAGGSAVKIFPHRLQRSFSNS
jgi:hypothetical protein